MLQRPGRQRKRQCEEQLRAIADEFFGALLTPVLQRAVGSAAVGDAASALVRHLPRRMRSDGDRQRSHLPGHGCRSPRRTPRETRPSGEEAGTLPRVVLGIRPVHAEAGLGCKPRGRHSLAPLTASPWISRPSARPPMRPSRARRASAGHRQAGGRLPRRGPRPREAQEASTKKGRNRFGKEPKLLILRRRRATVSDVGDHRRHAPGTGGGLRPAVVVRAADRRLLFIAGRALDLATPSSPRLPTQVLGLIDFYHAAKQLSDAVKLRRWSATQRTRWPTAQGARVDEVITALRELCAGAPPARSARTSTTS